MFFLLARHKPPFQLGLLFLAAGPRCCFQGSINALSDAGATCDLVTPKVATCRHPMSLNVFVEGIHGDLPMALICGWKLLVVDLDDCLRIKVRGILRAWHGPWQSPIQITGAPQTKSVSSDDSGSFHRRIVLR